MFEWCEKNIKVYKNNKFIKCFDFSNQTTTTIENNFILLAQNEVLNNKFKYQPTFNNETPVDPYILVNLSLNINATEWNKQKWNQFQNQFKRYC